LERQTPSISFPFVTSTRFIAASAADLSENNHVKRAAVEWQISSIAFHPFNIAIRRAWEVSCKGQSTCIEIQASDPAGGSNNWLNEPRDGAGTASYIQYLAATAELAQVDKVGRLGEEFRGYQQAFIQLARVFFEIP
jgi:hypothetical protein